MDGWMEELAAELGEDPLTSEEVTELLGVARDVAHRVERKITPLASFLIGTAVGRAEAGGMERRRAMEDIFQTLGEILPDEPPDATETPEAVSSLAPEAVTPDGSREQIAPEQG